MDTFFEQIIPMKKGGKEIAAIIGIWILALILAFLLLVFFAFSLFGFAAAAAVFYGAFKLSGYFSIEYEYIITNGTFDIDKIIAKSSRKRIASFELSKVEVLEKFNPNTPMPNNALKPIIVCNIGEGYAYKMVVANEGKPAQIIVLAPNERMREAIVKFLPKFIANSAFK